MLRSLLVAAVLLLAAGPAAAAPPQVPDVDLSRHSVPLREVVFDTFNGSFVRLSESSKTVRERLLDAIRPVYRPRYGGPQALSWLKDSDLVLGVAAGGRAYAFPLKVLNFRELVNATIGGRPVLVSYCPLCASAVVYSRVLDGRTLVFGNTSALYQSDLVMVDHQTGSYWFQVEGEAIVGPLTGKRLRALPSSTTTWGDWKRLHPGTRLLAADGGDRFDESFANDPFSGYESLVDSGSFAFPVSENRLDPRLRASEIVLVVEQGGARTAFPLRLIGDAAVNARVGGRPVVVFSRQTAIGGAFRPSVAGRRLTFRAERGRIVDRETGSTWDAAGRAVAGPLRGKSLEALPTRRGFWFAFAVQRPRPALYLPARR